MHLIHHVFYKTELYIRVQSITAKEEYQRKPYGVGNKELLRTENGNLNVKCKYQYALQCKVCSNKCIDLLGTLYYICNMPVDGNITEQQYYP